MLAEIVKSQPHAAYVAFTKSYKSRFPYFMRTIDSFEDYVEPIDEAINDQGMIFSFQFFFARRSPSLMSCENYSPFRPPTQGGLGIPDLKAEVSQQYAASKLIIAPHVAARLAKMNNAGQRQWCSWLNAVSLEEQDLTLNWQQFRDSLRLHYNLQLADLPIHCECGDRFTVSHSLSCKKTGFVAQRHDGIQNLLTSLLNKICKEVAVEPHLLHIDNEVFNLISTITSPS